MVVDLTEEQAQQLAPLFDTVVNAAKLGLIGMLVAQVGKDHGGKASMRVGFVRHARAKELVEQATEQVPTPGNAHE
jgi:hypothetical protein